MEIQISDNGTPFNSKKMGTPAKESSIKLHKIAPQHPSSNPAKNFMWLLGKAMKIAHMNKNLEKETLNQLLNNYRDTTHPAIGLALAAMSFRDGKQTVFCRKLVTDKDVTLARERDKQMKPERTDKISTTKYKKQDQIYIGDKVLLRNHTKQCKFDPLFLAQPYSVIDWCQ